MNVGLACAGTDGLRFYLEQYGTHVALKLKDKTSSIDWYVLSITTDGAVRLYDDIGSSSNLKLDSKCRITVEDPS